MNTGAEPTLKIQSVPCSLVCRLQYNNSSKIFHCFVTNSSELQITLHIGLCYISNNFKVIIFIAVSITVKFKKTTDTAFHKCII
jgi:hypothetical protein